MGAEDFLESKGFDRGVQAFKKLNKSNKVFEGRIIGTTVSELMEAYYKHRSNAVKKVSKIEDPAAKMAKVKMRILWRP